MRGLPRSTRSEPLPKPLASEELLNYAVDLVQDYGADALRLDTAIYLDLQFVKEVQQAAGRALS